MRRKTEVGDSRYAGVGADGAEYGVVSVAGEGSAYRRKPCGSCPWRRDAPTGRFPAQAYRESANTAYDAAFAMFACHETGADVAATCAGFLLRNSRNNVGARIAQATGKIDASKVGNPDDVPLYGSYREMAEANGVEPDDPVLAPCRADDE